MQLKKELPVAVPADKVWQVFAHDFDNGHEWMSSVYKSYANTEGGSPLPGAKTYGRIVEMDPAGTGMKASETFVKYDESSKTCTVKVEMIGVPSVFPVDHMTLDFSVTKDGDKSSATTWNFEAALKPWGYILYPLLKFGMSKSWSEMAEELKYFVETGESHPRKIAAMKKAKK